jgi:nucleotide-binding universal stress UspA family protein
MEPKHILFPVDFSENCTAVADYVEAMASGSGARVTLLHVVECPPPWYSDIEAARLSSVIDLGSIRKIRQDELNNYLRGRFDHPRSTRIVSQGEAAAQIVLYALTQAVSLIMMPTRGGGLFRRLLLGSTIAKVLHDTSCPVWTTSHSEHVAPARYPYRRIICGIDLSERSAETLCWALRLASEQHADMHVVHAIDVNEKYMTMGAVLARQYLRERAYEQWGRLKRETGFTAPLYIAYESVGVALRKAVHDLEGDIVVIGRGRAKQTLGRLRANSYAVIRESPCPVISV